MTLGDGASGVGPTRPNVVFILVDNLGWGDLGCYGGTVSTPRVDSLAAEGLRFSNYTVEAQCTPTRSAILTGRLPVRSGTTSVPLPGEGDYGLAPWEYTLAELFSDAGYATGAFGKWHLGEVAGRLPIDRGFDEWFGIKNTSDEAGYSSYQLFRELGHPMPQMWQGVRGRPVESAGVFDMQAKIHGDEKIVDRAVGFIDEHANAGRPFFAYIAFLHLHPPMGVHPDFVGASGGGLYADMVTEIDNRTGQVLDALKSAGIEDNTVIVFSSDNATSPLAGAGGGSNGPWRGHFFNPPFEGSHRVPAIVRWPGHIPTGRRSDQMLSAVDWLPTLAAIAGQSERVPTDRPIDGVNAADHLLGNSETSGRDSVLFFGIDGELMSVKWKNFKVILRTSAGINDPIVKPQMPIVYDLINDPGERWNLWEQSMDMGWVFLPVYERIAAFGESVLKYPNITAGQDFNGY